MPDTGLPRVMLIDVILLPGGGRRPSTPDEVRAAMLAMHKRLEQAQRAEAARAKAQAGGRKP